jgi:hypothetical protein
MISSLLLLTLNLNPDKAKSKVETENKPEKAALRDKRECSKCHKFRSAAYLTCSFPHGIEANGPLFDYAINCQDYESAEKSSHNESGVI